MLSRWKRRRRGREPSGAGGDELESAGRLVLGLEARREEVRMRTVDDLVERVLQPPRPFPDVPAAADRILDRLRQLRSHEDQVRGAFPWKPALIASVGVLLTAGLAFAGLRRRGVV